MRVVEPPEVLGISPQVFQVKRVCVAGNQALELNHREQGKPIGVDNTAKASDESGRLFTDLSVHAEKRHAVNVVDSADIVRSVIKWISEEFNCKPIFVRHSAQPPAGNEFVRDYSSHHVLVYREVQVQIKNIALPDETWYDCFRKTNSRLTS